MNTTYQLLTQDGVAPIHSAVYLGLDHMVELLINHGAQVDLKTDDEGEGSCISRE